MLLDNQKKNSPKKRSHETSLYSGFTCLARTIKRSSFWGDFSRCKCMGVFRTLFGLIIQQPATPVFVFCIMVSQIMISDLQRCASLTLQPPSGRNGGYRYYFFTLYFLDLVVCFWDPDSSMVDETSMKKITIWGSIFGTDFEHLQQIFLVSQSLADVSMGTMQIWVSFCGGWTAWYHPPRNKYFVQGSDVPDVISKVELSSLKWVLTQEKTGKSGPYKYHLCRDLCEIYFERIHYPWVSPTINLMVDPIPMMKTHR